MDRIDTACVRLLGERVVPRESEGQQRLNARLHRDGEIQRGLVYLVERDFRVGYLETQGKTVSAEGGWKN